MRLSTIFCSLLSVLWNTVSLYLITLAMTSVSSTWSCGLLCPAWVSVFYDSLWLLAFSAVYREGPFPLDCKILFCGRICSWLGHSTSCETALDICRCSTALGEVFIAKLAVGLMTNHVQTLLKDKPMGISRTCDGLLYVISTRHDEWVEQELTHKGLNFLYEFLKKDLFFLEQF